jgi:long-chain fatty acid transport protein
MYCVDTLSAMLRASAAATAVIGLTAPAIAGGFEVREQSSYFQGTSFAGAAAGGHSLSSIFWNPAASAYVGPGLVMDSSYSLINVKSQINATQLTGVPPGVNCGTFDCSVDIGSPALVPASYMAYRLDSRTVFALAMNSQFGTSIKPDNREWIGQLHARSAKLFSLNLNPSMSYEVAPGLSVGVGLQVQLLDLMHLRSASGLGAPTDVSNTISGDDIGVGLTAGINWRPNPGTSVGLGYRSSIKHSLEGSLKGPAVGGGSVPISADVTTPDKVTFSFSQAMNPAFRIMGTAEWTRWSALGVVPIDPVGLKLDFQWHDGWLFALGGEWNFSPKLTLRAGAAYEISPVQDPTERLVQIPDADRIWASIGGTYQFNDTMAMNFGYSHVFVQDASLERNLTTGTPPTLFAKTSSSVDIFSVGFTMKWGGPTGLK